MQFAASRPADMPPEGALTPLQGAARNLLRRFIAAPEPADISWAGPSLTAVGRFLHGYSLSPTPLNYRVAYRYLIDRDPTLAAAIDSWLARHGDLDEESMSAFAHDEDAQIKSEMVGQLASHIQRQLARATRLIGRSNDDVRSYGQALDSAVELLGASTDPADLARHLVKITQTMISKSERIETRLAAMAGQIDSLQRDLDRARRDAERDPLTGLLNRRAFLRRLDAAIAGAKVNHTMICVAFCDIDHFKRINDNHGHQVGDRVLKFVATRMAKKRRSDITLARYGGEEFVLLFEHTSIDSASDIIDSIRRDVSGRNLVDRVDKTPIGAVSFSAGIAQWIKGEGSTALIGRADTALYRAKALGRDRVEAASSARIEPNG